MFLKIKTKRRKAENRVAGSNGRTLCHANNVGKVHLLLLSLLQDIWKIRVQLTKPVTWPPLVWGVVCGAAASGTPLCIGTCKIDDGLCFKTFLGHSFHCSSYIYVNSLVTSPAYIVGNFHWTVEDVAKSWVCMMMSGPCLTGYKQTLNDWYDREIDGINEPYRPIPSGPISENEVITQIWVLLLGGLGLASILDVWAGHDFPIIFYLAIGGSLVSYIYSAPTLKLGIGIVNDFKSVEEDRALGLQSIPVAFGAETAKWICVIDITQISVASK
ncbi:hypothetical protein RHMOL_Rhmol04G0199400 [Rhododendron molle]|uniref:Uncharacterized protein n=1 Tax=Rhododendron molle TaxID=49168 RepID=A0ACC0P2P1_RHOML|nr:hypothetical protein RHMOL_Rhmol04G0199400 [Rhododendron molle]